MIIQYVIGPCVNNVSGTARSNTRRSPESAVTVREPVVTAQSAGRAVSRSSVIKAYQQNFLTYQENLDILKTGISGGAKNQCRLSG